MDPHPPDPALVTTRRGLHAVAEHVLGAALLTRRGRIGLRQAPGGFATQDLPVDLGGRPGLRRLAVTGTDLVVRDDDLDGGGAEVRAPLTTVGSAAALAGVTPGMPERVYRPETPLRPDDPLDLDADAAAFLAAVLAVGQAALTLLVAQRRPEDPAEVQLWPEHFDLATTIGEVNYGVSLGDDDHPWPYVYVGPWAPPPVDGFWNEPFGLARPLREVPTVLDVLDVFRAGHQRLAGSR